MRRSSPVSERGSWGFGNRGSVDADDVCAVVVALDLAFERAHPTSVSGENRGTHRWMTPPGCRSTFH